MLRTDDFGGRVKLRHLKILMAVAHSGSMAKAANSLAISHPVISKAIAELEQTLGLPLFDRTSHGVEPTLYGRALLERSVAILNDLRTTAKELEHLSDPTAGELRIGSGEATATGMLGVIIDRLLRQCPRLIFELTIAGIVPDLLHRDLRARTIDLIIGRLPSPIPDDMEAITLYNDELFIVAAMKNHLTRLR
jgi:DNA-binding transcriptional LysR family regulator